MEETDRVVKKSKSLGDPSWISLLDRLDLWRQRGSYGSR